MLKRRITHAVIPVEHFSYGQSSSQDVLKLFHTAIFVLMCEVKESSRSGARGWILVRGKNVLYHTIYGRL